jgi:hypothetical protein
MRQLYENGLPTDLFFGSEEEFESIIGWVTENTQTFVEGQVSIEVDTQEEVIKIDGEDGGATLTFEQPMFIKTNIKHSPLYNIGYQDGYKQATEDAIVALNKSFEL